MLIDFAFAALLILAIIKGYQKGLILAIFSIIAFIIGPGVFYCCYTGKTGR
jgi:membrane protein required for colicin V production